ncbi:hypothetical protein G7Z17_g5922 [Cylindrodendrum hubeiense]|uniref:Urea carboxylase n=1 Tax=Cylindrodendrum hubeiense TaxID=595255 RepID=A0A9P5HC05_9HYPO|nr:hypothetical protein G7Z17_g5922 [Cylindrodendrum hubeiense]
MGSIDSGSLRNIRKVLVANRDATSLHATLADEAVLLPGDDSTAYTDGDAILDICKSTGADAIIPGYGFLSENVEFADTVSRAGITFVGPSSTSIKAMGLKHEARAIAETANVPVIPGTRLLASAEEAMDAAMELGFPIMLKATGGGGGMGLQICHSEQEINTAFAMVESRASTLFKNSGVFLEKYYPRSRHIEVQVAGNGEIVVAFGERECSLQRRHQKVVEECPSPFVERNQGLREKMLEAAVNYASQLKYKSVGTVEFLVDDETADFFFLEMNTRLQVEHGITELCYGVDLVHLMLRQADYERGGQIGIPSDILQSLGRPQPLGSAIEARVYAEVPLRDFAPSPGVFQYVHWPEGDGVRVDTWVRSGQRITPLYDPLIGKIIVHSPDGRAAAQKMMLAALADTALQGTQSNLEYLSRVIESETFVSGSTLTNSLSTFKFKSCSLQVVDPGVFTTIQDYPGRITVGHGVPPSGPMDDLSGRAANVLVGNDQGVELLEITLAGPALLFHEAAVIAVCGAELPLTIDGESRPMWSRIIVKQGQTLKLGKITGNGLRTYLSLKGGFPEIPQFLGSKSTAPELAFGGLQGRKLHINDTIALPSQSGGWAAAATPLSLPREAIPDFTITSVYCMDGPYGSDDILTDEGRKTLYETDWVVSHNSGRSGIRLGGPRLKWARTSGGGGGSHPSNVFDYGYPNGGVNWTGESPIIFAHDRPDLGGFVCPTTVCSGEMWKVGQLKAGNTVRFRPTTFDTAIRITRAKDSYLEALRTYAQGNACQIPSLDIEFGDEPTPSIMHQSPRSSSHPQVTYRQGGDTCIIVEYGNQVSDLRNTACVQHLSKGLMALNLSSVRGDANFATLTVRFDPFQMDRSVLLQQLIDLNGRIGGTAGMKIAARQVQLPICVDHSSLRESAQRYMENIRPTAAYLPDNIEYLRKSNALQSRRDVFDSLLKTPWLAVAVGFYVGTPIMFPLDPRYLFTGQKYNPNRVYTPSGSVGLGGSLLCVYPIAAPGGYQLMGRTLSAWDTAGNRPGFSLTRPWLFNHFDLIRFYEVSEEEYNKAQQDFEAGRFVFDITETTLDMDEYIAKFDAANRDPEYLDWRERQAAAAMEMGELEQRLFDEWSTAKAAESNDAADEDADVDSSKAVLIESPVDANVWKVLVQPGDELQTGQTVAVLEAMKMEINIVVGDDQAGAVVVKISQPPGTVVSPGTVVTISAARPRNVHHAICRLPKFAGLSYMHLLRPYPGATIRVRLWPHVLETVGPCPPVYSSLAPISIFSLHLANIHWVDRCDGWMLTMIPRASRDLLSLHYRRSHCSAPTPDITQARRDSATERPPQPTADRVSWTGPEALSPPLARSPHGQTSPSSYVRQPGTSLVFEGTRSQFATRAHATHTIDVIHDLPTTAIAHLAPAAPSQEQFMGKFSIHYPAIQDPEHSPGDVSRSSGDASYREDNVEMAIETAPDFMQFQPFDVDFFSNETDMISDYLMGVFPPMNYQPSLIENAPDGAYNATDGNSEPVLPRAPLSNDIELLAPMHVSLEPNQHHANTIHPHTVDPENGTSLARDGIGASLDAIDDIIATNPWAVSAVVYERLSVEVMKHEHIFPDTFVLPCRQTLTRHFASFVRGFHPHLPFIHLSTTCLDSMSPMLLLALVTVGSFYGFEHSDGYTLYFVAKAIVTKKLEERRREAASHLLRCFPHYAGLPPGASGGSNASTPQSVALATVDIELVQALMVLILAMSWLDGPLAEDALAMSSQLSELAREALKIPHITHVNDTWKEWAHEEEWRRTLFSVYFVFNIQTICFNVPPLLPNSEMNLPLPCSEVEWKAPNATAWNRLHRKGSLRDMRFYHHVKQLLSGKPLDMDVPVTEFGNYLLIQGLVQQIYFERQAASALLSSSASLPAATIKIYDAALRAWQSCWDSAIESTLDPASPHGPLAFNSTAMLRLAHIHLGVGMYTQCMLRTRDPRVLARAFETGPNPIALESAHLDQAVLHAIYALRVLVRVGIAVVARGRTGHWSVQHAICNFACALLLANWLENLFCLVSSDGLEALRSEDKRLLGTIERLIQETHLEGSLGPKDSYPGRIRRLAIAALRLWAETCKGIQVFEIVYVVGETLSLIAESLEKHFER